MTEAWTGHAFFAAFDADLLGQLAACSRDVQFGTGEVLLQEGGPADRFYAITSGRVAVGVRTPAHGLTVIETLHRGDILGWSWLFPPHRWTFDAVALKPVTAVEIGTRCLMPLLERDPRAAAAVYRSVGELMSQRLHSARLRLADIYGVGDADH